MLCVASSVRFAGSTTFSIIFKEGTDVKTKPALLKRAGKAFKKATPTILTCISAAGVVVTVVLAVKATPKALKCIEKEKEVKNAENGENLTRMETIAACWRCYIPAAATGIATIGCTAMTVAIAKALLECKGDYTDLGNHAIRCMQEIGQKYPNVGYGQIFYLWLHKKAPKPYWSYGNGSAMRVSPVAYAAKSAQECIDLADAVTKVSHDHPEGMKGAEATALITFGARSPLPKQILRELVQTWYYTLDFSIDEIRPTYRFDASCQGSVPQAIEAFLESEDFEDAIRIAVSLGGDSDTIAAIAGGIAGAYYGVPDDLWQKAAEYNGLNGTGAGDVLGISFDLVIPASGWKDGSITIADSRLLALATHKYFLSADEACKEEFIDCNVQPKDITTTGFITFTNDSDPTMDLTVNLIRFELSGNGAIQ